MMPDVLSKQQRSFCMSRIRGKGNKETELAIISLFRTCGIKGWRRYRPVFGKPDFVFPNIRLAIFVDGCFWHGCPTHGNLPVSNRQFWENKLEGNKRRDRKVNRTLRESGWKVIRIWAHELAPTNRTKLAQRINSALKRAMANRSNVFLQSNDE